LHVLWISKNLAYLGSITIRAIKIEFGQEIYELLKEGKLIVCRAHEGGLYNVETIEKNLKHSVPFISQDGDELYETSYKQLGLLERE